MVRSMNDSVSIIVVILTVLTNKKPALTNINLLLKYSNVNLLLVFAWMSCYLLVN